MLYDTVLYRAYTSRCNEAKVEGKVNTLWTRRLNIRVGLYLGSTAVRTFANEQASGGERGEHRDR